MSLNFDLKKIEDFKEVCWQEDGSINPTTQNLIFKTMAIGMREITKSNWSEFYARSRIFDRLIGYDDPPLTPQEVHQHIGLSTNASTETLRQFVMRHMEHSVSDFAREAEAWSRANVTTQ